MSLHAMNRPPLSARRLLIITLAILTVLILVGAQRRAHAQTHTHAPTRDTTMTHGHSAAEINAELHMEMSPERPATAADSARAAGVAALLREALGKYHDTTAAVRDGYKMFMPENKKQKTYHFTNNWHAVQEAFRFDPAKPTSLLYKQDSSGTFILLGAMYTAPKRWGPGKLNERVPLSIARWHKHVNWCLPVKDKSQRWLERKDGHAVFGPGELVVGPARDDCAIEPGDALVVENRT